MSDKLTVTPENVLAVFEKQRERTLDFPRALSIPQVVIDFIRDQGRSPYSPPPGATDRGSSGGLLTEAQIRSMHVSLSAIRRALNTLVEQGKLVALRGDEFAGTGLNGYGIRADVTYYLLPDVLEVSRAKWAEQAEADLRAQLHELAKEVILDRHIAEVDSEYQRLLRANGLGA